MARSFLTQLGLTGAMTAAAAAAGTAATTPNVDDYQRLDTPPFSPPRQVFPIAWTALYADIAATTAVALDRAGSEAERRRILTELAVNLGLNAGWCAVFFAARRRWAATAVAGALTVSSVGLALRVGRHSRAAGWALAPYPAWCAFATVLSGSVAARND